MLMMPKYLPAKKSLDENRLDRPTWAYDLAYDRLGQARLLS